MKRIMSLVLAVCLLLGVGLSAKEANASSFYFAGKYTQVYAKTYLTLSMNQYSSPEGKEVGNFEIEQYYRGETSKVLSGVLKKTSKENVYKCGSVRFKVYKKKVKIKNSESCDGTYKLKKRYYS